MTAEQAMKTEKMAERSMVVGDDDERSLRSKVYKRGFSNACVCGECVGGSSFEVSIFNGGVWVERPSRSCLWAFVAGNKNLGVWTEPMTQRGSFSACQAF